MRCGHFKQKNKKGGGESNEFIFMKEKNVLIFSLNVSIISFSFSFIHHLQIYLGESEHPSWQPLIKSILLYLDVSKHGDKKNIRLKLKISA